MPTLSVCCLARNEESTIKDMIASVRELDAEVIVLDTGSTDSTVATAQGLGARVEHFEWTEDFSEARNALLKHATGDWILMLDADEYLEAESIEAVRTAMASIGSQAWRCFVVNELPHPVVRPRMPLRSMRLFRRHEDLHYVNRVHEDFEDSLRRLTWSADNSTIRIRHTGYAVGDRRKRLRNRRVLSAHQSASMNIPVTSICAAARATGIELGG